MKGFYPTHKSRLIILFVLGLYAVSAQVVLLREFLMIFGGNELLIGVFLATWMLLTALGSYSGKFILFPRKQIPYWTLLYGWMAIILMFLMDLFRDTLFLPGVQPTVVQVSLISALFLLPVCFLSGLLFSNLFRELSGSGMPASAELTYGIESLGSMAGGFLITFALNYLYDNFRAISIITLLGSLLIIIPGLRSVHRMTRFSLVFVFSVILFLIFMAGGRFSRQFLFKNQVLLENKDTPYGNLAVTNTFGQLNFFENNVLLFSTDNQLASEEAVHYAMVQHPLPRNVLLISGGIAGLAGEILKYQSVEEVDYLEIDPVLLVLGKKYTRIPDDERINPVTGDPRIFLRQSDKKYDIVIVYLPEPSTYQLNRYYTTEFMVAVKNSLSDSGYLTFSLPRSANYLNEGEVNMHSSLYSACKGLFREVVIFPGEKSRFVASDSNIKMNIGQLIENKHINNDYVNFYYIDEQAMLQRTRSLMNQLSMKAKNNTDFQPVVVSAFFQYWLSQFGLSGLSFRIPALALLVLVIVFVMASPPALAGMFSAGFTTSALQVVLLVSFQVLYGYVYRSLGLFSALFMAGLASGALLRHYAPAMAKRFSPAVLQLILAGISLLIPSMIGLSGRMISLPFLVHLLYLIMILIISFITGLIFSISAVRLNAMEKTVPVVYAADLAGAALGALTVTLIVIPVTGILNSPYLLSLISLTACLSFLKRKQKII